MKKLLCFLTISFLFISTGYSQEQPKQSESNTVTQVVDKVFDRTTEAIQELANALKVPAEHVYSVLVKQQVILGWASAISVGVFLILSIVFCLWTRNDEYDNVGIGAGAIFSCMLFGVALIIFLSQGLSCLLNPEYGAIKDILQVM